MTPLRKILSPEGNIFNSARNKAPDFSIFTYSLGAQIQKLGGRLLYLLFQYVLLLFWICFLVELSFLPFSPGHGFGSTKMSRAQTFPSYASEQSEETQQSLSRSSSYGFSYSSSLIQWHTEGHCWPERQSVLDLLVGSLHPLPPRRPIAVKVEMGRVSPQSQWKVKNWNSASLILWLSPLLIEFLGGKSMFYKNRIQIVWAVI